MTNFDRSCKKCGEIFTPFRTFDKLCYLCTKTELALKNLEKIKKEKKKKQKEDLLTLQDYLKLAQQVFNKWVRLRDKGEPCISCKKVINGKTDAGHLYAVGNYPSVRFNETNVNSQCIFCNRYNGGLVNEYRINYVQKYSIEQLEELDQLAHKSRKYTKEELKELIAEYKEKIKSLEK